MTTATRPLPRVAALAGSLSRESGHPIDDWQAAIEGAGGERRAGELLDALRIPRARMTPGALIVAHFGARLLDLDFDGPTAPT